MLKSRVTVFIAILAVALLALPAAAEHEPDGGNVAADNVIRGGIDLWHTPDDGSTTATFATEPIPADFFCLGSKPFTGTIPLRGVPLVTEPAGVLGNADTIMERLDDATFDEEGVAHTRLRIRALHLASLEPVETECGAYDVTVSLAGEQPVSPHMMIVREKGDSGYFTAEFGLDFKVTFTPVDGGEPVELTRSTVMRSNPVHPWASVPGEEGVIHEDPVLVDTDLDGVADTTLPGTSDFAVGWAVGPDGETKEVAAPLASDHYGSGTHQVAAVQRLKMASN